MPISDSDELAMKGSSERSLSVLGFSPQDCVCQHQTVGSSVQVVVPSPADLVSYLCHAAEHPFKSSLMYCTCTCMCKRLFGEKYMYTYVCV